MREIKFRVFGSEYMSNPFTLLDLQEGKIQFASSAALIQFTGKSDLNDKEIYEGDVNQDKGVCFWNNDDCSFCWKYPTGDVYQFDDEPKWCAVIGNIYENPDLLK